MPHINKKMISIGFPPLFLSLSFLSGGMASLPGLVLISNVDLSCLVVWIVTGDDGIKACCCWMINACDTMCLEVDKSCNLIHTFSLTHTYTLSLSLSLYLSISLSLYLSISLSLSISLTLYLSHSLSLSALT